MGRIYQTAKGEFIDFDDLVRRASKKRVQSSEERNAGGTSVMTPGNKTAVLGHVAVASNDKVIVPEELIKERESNSDSDIHNGRDDTSETIDHEKVVVKPRRGRKKSASDETNGSDGE